MRKAALWFLMMAGTLPALGQGEEEFGAAVKRSLDRSGFSILNLRSRIPR